MLIETSLLFKTIVILSGQLGIIIAVCFYCLKRARIAYETNTSFMGLYFRGAVNLKRKLDLIPYRKVKETFPKKMVYYFRGDKFAVEIADNQDEVIKWLKKGYQHEKIGKDYLWPTMIFWFICLFGTSMAISFLDLNVWIQASFFTATSISFGPLLAFVMLEMDENDGFTALKIVLAVTLMTGFIGYGDFYSFSENTLFGYILLIALFGLILFNFARFFMEISRPKVRISAIFGAILFSALLLYDFDYLEKQSAIADKNTWANALDIAFILYLDIINLLLEILKAMDS
jgi:FtsH-binding integral membrane protein